MAFHLGVIVAFSADKNLFQFAFRFGKMAFNKQIRIRRKRQTFYICNHGNCIYIFAIRLNLNPFRASIHIYGFPTDNHY